ncbi:XdhC family aldehyde oxidoreductase maturation factor [Desulfolucanica intricata]|uniref:XdhC family aldehyde oxidoreductase maturation factor n=1 Tax=Desulfolucanica intricata TaxID=1285191 RepID=UPI0008373967|nr:XdhC/CoxI family protein [Desulfolucanica intricata]
MVKIFYDMLRLLEQGESFVLATILTQLGSAPRTAGTKMIVRKDGTIAGTIGGGLVEARVMETAREIFALQKAVVKEYNLTAAAAGQMDMICGGHIEVLIDYIDAADVTNLHIYRALTEAVTARQKAVLLTTLPGGAGDKDKVKLCLISNDGKSIGEFSYPQTWLEELLRRADSRYPQVVAIDDKRFLVEQVSSCGTVYIFGAGHVSQKLALLTKMVDFTTVVLDDRKEFANKERFPTADRLIVLPSFAEDLTALGVNRDSYVVIVTRGHAHDKTVLASALRTQASYIGMIGSKKKRDTIYRALQNEGYTGEELKRVHSPIGLAIEAETPEEIAVSIVAELIKERASQKNE